jgi:hypothetical protein
MLTFFYTLTIFRAPGQYHFCVAFQAKKKGRRVMCPLRFDLSDSDAFAFCSSCGAGYQAGITHCSDCQLELTPRAEIERQAARDLSDLDETDGMKIVYSTTRPLKAHMLTQTLQEHDIAARLEGEQAGKHFAQPVTIWVPDKHYAEAERLIVLIEESLSDSKVEVTPEAEDSESRRVAAPIGSDFIGGLLVGLFLGVLTGAYLAHGVYKSQQRTSPEKDLPAISDRNGDGIEDAWIKYSLANNEPIYIYDTNLNGSPDEWNYFENGVLVRSEHDRNDDGKVDSWWYYNGMRQPLRAERDDDFSGESDYWLYFENGEYHEFTEDRDFDGQVDSWGSFENSLLKEWNISFRNDRVADKRILYERNRRMLIEYDRDRDGEFEDVRLLNAFEEFDKSIGQEHPPR